MSDDLVKRLRDWEHVWPDDMDKPAGHLYEDAADRIEELEAKLAELQDVRRWYHYPIEMPLSADGQGPATIGTDARKITYEVWDVLLHTHASFDNLPDAINEAMRLNATLAELTGGKDE